jgi:hypothetical protein
MKSLFLKIKHYLNLMFNRKYRKFQEINTKLHKTIQDREVDRIVLKFRIKQMVKQYLKLNTGSKYIPSWNKSDAEIKEEVLHKYGEQMKALGIKINDKLKLSV